MIESMRATMGVFDDATAEDREKQLEQNTALLNQAYDELLDLLGDGFVICPSEAIENRPSGDWVTIKYRVG